MTPDPNSPHGRLLPVTERDRLVHELVETSHFYDEATGELYAPPVLPPDPDGTDWDDGLEP